MDKDEFIKDFSGFYAELRKEGVDELLKDATMLYTIYRKDLRADRFNNRNGSNSRPSDQSNEPATEKQKQYLLDLAYEKGVCITQKQIDRMTREQASKTINALLGGD